jgi:hypothetical protein
VVDGGGLENHCTRKGTGGSNPSLSARQLAEALDGRHLANLTRSEAGRALRALSYCYVERRAKLAAGAPLETAGKRAAFALYYGPLHFITIGSIARASGVTAPRIRTVHDFGCGTGVSGAAWALASECLPSLAGIDRSAWAVDEANWLYRQAGLRGRAVRGDLLRALRPRAAFGEEDALLFGYSLNELPDASRHAARDAVIDAVTRGATLLIVEPIGKRLGTARWWSEWRTALQPHGVREDEWRLPGALLPDTTHALGRAAGLDPREVTARSLITRGRAS